MVRGMRGHDRLWDVAALGALALAALALCWPLGLTNRILAGIDAFTYFTPYWAYRMEALPGRRGSAVEPLSLLRRAVPGQHPGRGALPSALAAELVASRTGAGVVGAAARLDGERLHLPGFARRHCVCGHHLAAFGAGSIFGLGGFTLARIENINQLNAPRPLRQVAVRRVSAPAEPCVQRGRLHGALHRPERGHRPAAAGRAHADDLHQHGRDSGCGRCSPWAGRCVPRRLWPLLSVVIAVGLAAAAAAAHARTQRPGPAHGGLPYRQAVSFSLRPQLLLQSLLPPFGRGLAEAFGSEGYAEFVGYVGVSGLLLARA